MSEKTIMFQNWVISHGDDLYNWAFAKTKSKELSEDLVQESFISAFNSYEKFQNRSNPKTWLIAILNNKIVDYYRKTSKISYTTIEENRGCFFNSMFDEDNFWLNNLEEAVGLANKNSHSSELKLKICLNNLPKKWNLAISYKFFSEKATKEICKELKISESNYWQIVHRAKILLKKCIETNQVL